jgi:hypothetical protein
MEAKEQNNSAQLHAPPSHLQSRTLGVNMSRAPKPQVASFAGLMIGRSNRRFITVNRPPSPEPEVLPQ